MRYVLALDEGTTSARALVVNHSGQVKSIAQREFPQIFPSPAHVEHDPEAIWETQLQVARDSITQAMLQPQDIAAIGITNQRETTVIWERDTGKPVANAIVWQSRITSGLCDNLIKQGLQETFRNKTGLVIDPYFSGTKITYLLETIPGLRNRAERGEVLFGTIDSFLLWRLTNGKLHLTDYSNASRTLLFNIHTLDWDDELLSILNVPRAMLPEVRPSSEVYGHADPQWFGAPIPIAGMAGDQQAATFGQACFSPGSAKNTYGTGCFMLLNTGETPVPSQNGLLTTIGWGIDGKVTYCLEGAIFVAGAVVQWLRDNLGFIQESSEVEQLAAQVPDNGGVFFVPAFVGLGAPHWDPHARGTIVGLTRGTERGHLARAALEAMAFQTRDVLDAMQADANLKLKELKVDGGASVNDLLMQFQSDVLGVAVRRPQVSETTALGAAYLAGLAVGFWSNQQEVINNWGLDREFHPQIEEAAREKSQARWREAIKRSRNWAQDD